LLQELVDEHAIYRDRSYALADLRDLRGLKMMSPKEFRRRLAV
jgi:hypothetical protein